VFSSFVVCFVVVFVLLFFSLLGNRFFASHLAPPENTICTILHQV
jgi:hypothetical protein